MKRCTFIFCAILLLFSSCIGPGIQDFHIDLPEGFLIERYNTTQIYLCLYKTNVLPSERLNIDEAKVLKFAYDSQYIYVEAELVYGDDSDGVESNNAERSIPQKRFVAVDYKEATIYHYKKCVHIFEDINALYEYTGENSVPYSSWLSTSIGDHDWTDPEEKERLLSSFKAS